MNKQLKVGLKRLAAALLDYGIFLLFFIIYVRTFGEQQPDGTYKAQGFRHFFIIVLVWIIYFPVLESSLGFTLGKGLFDLKVIGTNGRKPSFSQSFKRHIIDFFDFLFFTTVAFITIRNSPDGVKRLGDMWAKTKVVADE
jgi:uncharacterized RDD family membrane protein YckC